MLEVRARYAADLPALEGVLLSVAIDAPRCDPDTRQVSAAVDRVGDPLHFVVRALEERRVPADTVSLRRPTLDEVFLALTGESIPLSDHDASRPADAA